MGSYINGSVSVQPGSPTLICTVPAENDNVLIQNAGTAAVFIGGPDVDVSGDNRGISVASSSILPVPSVGGMTNDLYGITEAVAQPVVFLMPQSP